MAGLVASRLRGGHLRPGQGLRCRRRCWCWAVPAPPPAGIDLRQLNCAPGSKPNDDIKFHAMDWAVPGSGAGNHRPAGPAWLRPGCRRCIVREAASMTIICWRRCSSTSMARPAPRRSRRRPGARARNTGNRRGDPEDAVIATAVRQQEVGRCDAIPAGPASGALTRQSFRRSHLAGRQCGTAGRAARVAMAGPLRGQSLAAQPGSAKLPRSWNRLILAKKLCRQLPQWLRFRPQ